MEEIKYQTAFYKSMLVVVLMIIVLICYWSYQSNRYDNLSRDHDEQNVAISNLSWQIDVKDEEIKTKDTKIKQLQNDLEKSK